MTKRLSHYLFQDVHRIGRCLVQAQADDGIHARGVAFIADIVALYAPGLTRLFFVADGAFHHLVRVQIFQRRFADQTFIFHNYAPPVVIGWNSDYKYVTNK